MSVEIVCGVRGGELAVLMLVRERSDDDTHTEREREREKDKIDADVLLNVDNCMILYFDWY